jgi:hypothetical protein
MDMRWRQKETGVLRVAQCMSAGLTKNITNSIIYYGEWEYAALACVIASSLV